MIEINEYDYDHFIYGGVSDLVDEVSKIPEHRRVVRYHATDFHGNPNIHKFSDAIHETNRPWQTGIDATNRMLDEIRDADIPRPVSRQRRSRFSEVNGDEVCYDRLRSGQPFWRETVRQNVLGPTSIAIMVDIGAMACISPHEMMWRGAAAVALADMLESVGYRVELWAFRCLRESRKDGGEYGRWQSAMQSINIKRAQDPVDVSSLATVVSPWFYRTVFAQGWYHGDKYISSGWGGGRKPSDAMYDETGATTPRIEIRERWSYKEAVACIREAIASIQSLIAPEAA